MNGFSPPYHTITWPHDVSFIARTRERHARMIACLSLPSDSSTLSRPLPLHFLTCIQRTRFAARKEGGGTGKREGESKYHSVARIMRVKRQRGLNSRNTHARQWYFFFLSFLSTHIIDQLTIYLSISFSFSLRTPRFCQYRGSRTCVGWKKGIRDHAQHTGNCPHSARRHRGWTDRRMNGYRPADWRTNDSEIVAILRRAPTNKWRLHAWRNDRNIFKFSRFYFLIDLFDKCVGIEMYP